VNLGSGLRRLGAVVLAVVALVVPATALLGAMDRLDGLSERAAVDDVVPLVTTPTPADIDQAASVSVTPVFGQRVDVVAPAWSGVVTDTIATPGQTLESGSPVVEIDGIVRRAYATDRPFYRPLGIGSEGDDVIELHRILTNEGLLPEERSGDARFTSSTLRATRGLASSIGVPSPTSVSTFDPAWVMWQPAHHFIVEGVAVVTGATAPPAGEPVLVGPARIIGLRIEGEQGTPVDTAGSRTLAIGDHVVDLEDGRPTVDALALLSEGGAFATEPSVEGAGPAPVIAELALKMPIRALAIPASAVQGSSTTDDLCVWLFDGDGGFEPEPVTVHPGGASTVYVTGGLNDRSEVLTNPAEYLNRSACP